MNEEEINEDNIDKIMHDAIQEGTVEIAALTDDGDLKFKISEKGEKYIIDTLMGGQDVADNTKRLNELLVKSGFMGFDIPNNITTFTIISGVLKIVKHCRNWENLTRQLKRNK